MKKVYLDLGDFTILGDVYRDDVRDLNVRNLRVQVRYEGNLVECVVKDLEQHVKFQCLLIDAYELEVAERCGVHSI